MWRDNKFDQFFFNMFCNLKLLCGFEHGIVVLSTSACVLKLRENVFLFFWSAMKKLNKIGQLSLLYIVLLTLFFWLLFRNSAWGNRDFHVSGFPEASCFCCRLTWHTFPLTFPLGCTCKRAPVAHGPVCEVWTVCHLCHSAVCCHQRSACVLLMAHFVRSVQDSCSLEESEFDLLVFNTSIHLFCQQFRKLFMATKVCRYFRSPLKTSDSNSLSTR